MADGPTLQEQRYPSLPSWPLFLRVTFLVHLPHDRAHILSSFATKPRNFHEFPGLTYFQEYPVCSLEGGGARQVFGGQRARYLRSLASHQSSIKCFDQESHQRLPSLLRADPDPVHLLRRQRRGIHCSIDAIYSVILSDLLGPKTGGWWREE